MNKRKWSHFLIYSENNRMTLKMWHTVHTEHREHKYFTSFWTFHGDYSLQKAMQLSVKCFQVIQISAWLEVKRLIWSKRTVMRLLKPIDAMWIDEGSDLIMDRPSFRYDSLHAKSIIRMGKWVLQQYTISIGNFMWIEYSILNTMYRCIKTRNQDEKNKRTKMIVVKRHSMFELLVFVWLMLLKMSLGQSHCTVVFHPLKFHCKYFKFAVEKRNRFYFICSVNCVQGVWCSRVWRCNFYRIFSSHFVLSFFYW